MVNARMMYLRPGSLFKDFIIENNKQIVTGTGRVADSHAGDGADILKGCIVKASAEERENHSQKEHIVTHIIVQRGKQKAKRGDRLVLEKRVFYIVDIDDCGAFGISTVYYVEERRDTR